MSNDNKPAPQPQKRPDVERIPVRVLAFGHHNPTEIPGASGQTTITAQGEKNKTRYEIDFIPAWRHFRVAYIRVDSDVPQVRFVHESKVSSWEPLA